MKRTLASIILGLVLAAAMLSVTVFARGCYATMMAVDPETGEQVNCYLHYESGGTCHYRCPWGDVEQ
jgi:hypothetical protein